MTREDIAKLWACYQSTASLESFLNKAYVLHPNEYTSTLRAIWFAFDIAVRRV
jgi:hypothetical protein